MSLCGKQTLIGVCCAAHLLNLSESAVREGLCGTENLTRVRRGSGKRQRVSFILEEVIALKAEQIESSRRPLVSNSRKNYLIG